MCVVQEEAKKKQRQQVEESSDEDSSHSDAQHPNTFQFNPDSETFLHPICDKENLKMPRSTRNSAAAGTGGRENASRRTADDVAEPAEDVVVLKKQIAALKGTVKQLSSVPSGKNRKNKTKRSGIDRAMASQVKKAVAEHLWPKVKFIESDKMLERMAGVLFDKLDLQEKEGLQGVDLETAKQVWVHKWMDDIRQAYNDRRNYVQQQLHDLVKDALTNDNLDQLPNLNEIRLLAQRADMVGDDPDQERMRDLFGVYWEKLVPCVAGVQHWGPNRKYYQCLSTATLTPNDPDSPLCVTPSDEAYLVVLYENNYKKWYYTYYTMKGKEEELKTLLAEGDREAVENMETPYTNPRAGQVKFGGWLAAGKSQFKQVKKAVSDARKEAHVPELEGKVLKMLRVASGTEDRDKNGNGSKKRKRGADFFEQEDDEEELDDDLDNWE